MGELIVESIQSYLEELLPDLGLELFDVQFRQEDRGWVLRVFIDTPDDSSGVSLDQCGQVSRELGQYLDVEDIIEHAYNLEVSSPGLERPLRSPDEFARHKGKLCKIRLHDAIDNQKVFVGEIVGVSGDEIVLALEAGELKIDWNMLNKARLFLA